MRMMVAVVFIFALSLTPIRADSLKNISIETRPGVSVSVLMLTPDNPKAALIMLPGGPGMAKISGTSLGRTRGFITANFENFAAYSLAVAIVDTPSDRPDGLSPRFRQTGSHLKDLEAVIRRVRQETKLPVWLIGISRGSISVLHGALNSKAPIDGFIALSSPTRIPPQSGVVKLTDLDLDRIKVPALAGGHEDDACRGTPPAGARRLARGMINSPKAEEIIFSGGRDQGRNPCGPGSPHTFEGIQDKVGDKVAEFIILNSR